MTIEKKPEVGMTLEVVLSGEDVEAILTAYNEYQGRTHDGERAYQAALQKYGGPIVDFVVTKSRS